MRRRVVRLLALLGCAAIAVAARAQDTIPPQPTSDTPPLLVLVMQRAPNEPLRKDDPNLTLQRLLRGALSEAGRFSLFNFNPNHATIKRALLERVLSTSDLMEPISDLGLKHIGEALGARYVLAFAASEDREGLKTNVILLESVGPTNWRTLLSEEIHVPAAKITGGGLRVEGATRIVTPASRRRRLKLDEMATVTVAAIATRLGVRYTVPSDLQQIPDAQFAAGRDERPLKSGRSNDTPKSAPSQPLPPDAATAATPARSGPAVVPNTQPLPTPREPLGPPTPAQPEPPPIGDTPPAPSTNEKVPGATPVDNEALALQFRQKGDLANVINALRRAINERPSDIGLRRQLVRAYIDHQLTDLAQDEVSRALVIAPKDGELHDLEGQIQLAGGNAVAARKDIEAEIKDNPTDPRAWVSLGDLQMKDNSFPEAMNSYNKAAELDAKSPLPHRRKAIALLTAAIANSARYAASLEELRKARSLTPAADADTYSDDYVAVARVVRVRITDLLDELQATYQAQRSGQRSVAEIKQSATDLRSRADAVADYLDKLRPATGMDVTHAHIQQAGGYLLQAISGLRDYLSSADPTAEDTMNSARTNALRELDTVAKRLALVRPSTG